MKPKKSSNPDKAKTSLLDDEEPRSKTKKGGRNTKPERSFDGTQTVQKTLMLNKSNALRIGTMQFANSTATQVDIRRWYLEKGSDDLKPAKGVMFPAAMLPDVIKQLKKLQRRLDAAAAVFEDDEE